MINFGPVPIGAVLPVIFDSFAGSTGASVTITGLAVTDIEIYKGTSMTQRSSDAGYTLLDTDGIDLDGITGIHGFSIDTGDNTDAGFYASGSFYTVVVSAITVDSQTVNFVAATFRCVTAEGVAGQPKVDVAAFGGSAGTFSGGRPEVNTTHAAGTAWNSGAIGANTLASDTIAAAKIATGAITAAKFAAGAIDAAAIADNAIDAGAIAADAITAAKIANGAIDAATFAADVDAEILSYLVDDATRIDASALNTLSSHDPGEAIMGATDLGTGAGLTSLAPASDMTAVLADTNELQTDWVNGGRLDLLIDAIKAKTDSLNFTVAGQVDANLQSINDVALTGDGSGTPFNV